MFRTLSSREDRDGLSGGLLHAKSPPLTLREINVRLGVFIVAVAVYVSLWVDSTVRVGVTRRVQPEFITWFSNSGLTFFLAPWIFWYFYYFRPTVGRTTNVRTYINRDLKAYVSAWPRLLVYAVVFNFLFFAARYLRTQAYSMLLYGSATAVFASFLLFVYALSLALLPGDFSPLRLAASVVGAGGLIATAFSPINGADIPSISNVGYVLMFVSAFLFALYQVLVSYVATEHTGPDRSQPSGADRDHFGFGRGSVNARSLATSTQSLTLPNTFLLLTLVGVTNVLLLLPNLFIFETLDLGSFSPDVTAPPLIFRITFTQAVISLALFVGVIAFDVLAFAAGASMALPISALMVGSNSYTGAVVGLAMLVVSFVVLTGARVLRQRQRSMRAQTDNLPASSLTAGGGALRQPLLDSAQSLRSLRNRHFDDDASDVSGALGDGDDDETDSVVSSWNGRDFGGGVGGVIDDTT